MRERLSLCLFSLCSLSYHDAQETYARAAPLIKKRRWGLVRDPNGGIALIFVTPEKVGKSGKFKVRKPKF